MNTTTRLGLSVIDTPAVDTVNNLRQSINNHATILDAQYIESTYASRPAAASKGRVHRSTDTGEVAIDTGTAWEPLWGPPTISRPVLDTGQVGQTRAGRQWSGQDFLDCGAAVPLGLWNLSDTSDASGNGRSLTNKGSVPFGVGIEGLASTAAVFAGATSQSLYRDDTGAADPFRIKTGTWGVWHQSAKSGVDQCMISKARDAGNLRSYLLGQNSSGRYPTAVVSLDGINWNTVIGSSRIDDGRWHFVAASYDGYMLRVYCDGWQDGFGLTSGGPIFAGAAPLNIGSSNADSGTAATQPHYGKLDEAFVTNEVLSLEQIRHLFGVKLAHGMPTQPRRASLRITRRRRGGALANGDFPSNPARAHNLAAGALTELNGGTALTASGTPVTVAGPDGQKDSALFLGGSAYLQASDTGLPSGTSDRSYGGYFQTFSSGPGNGFMGWGSYSANCARLIQLNGVVAAMSDADQLTGVWIADGLWHHLVVAETNTPTDGLKRKLYMDGFLIGGSTVLNSITLVGANGFKVGANPDGGSPFVGAVSRPFVHPAALSPEQVRTLFQKSSTFGAQKTSPKDAADHIEGLWENSLIFIGDDLEPQDLIDLEVSR